MEFGSTLVRSMREVKVCLLGDSGVGKSSLVLRFVSDRFDPQTSAATIGASFMSKTLTLQEKTVKFQIWDTAGQEKYKALAPMYYRGASAAIVVYDITVENSFSSVKAWVKELNQLGPKNIIIAIAGNKCDRAVEREVETRQGKEYAEDMGAIFVETSALTAENVYEVFSQICAALPQDAERYPYQTMPQRNLFEENKKQETGCCNS